MRLLFLGWVPSLLKYGEGLFYIFAAVELGRIIGVDYGKKRCGVAMTDVLQISINPLFTCSPDDLIEKLKEIIQVEDVKLLVWGRPIHADGSDMELFEDIRSKAHQITINFPQIEQVFVDESFSSHEANQIRRQMLGSRKKMKNASLDEMSAVLIIKRYLEQK